MARSLRHRLYSLGFAVIEATGADHWLGPLTTGRGVILMFHRVRPWKARPFAPNQMLEISPEFLDLCLSTLKAMGFRLISLDDVPHAVRERAPNHPFAVLTFDDGYRDNLEFGLPVLRKHSAPWTIYVTSQFAEGTGRLWWLELEEAVATLPEIRICAPAGPPILLRSKTVREKLDAFTAIYGMMRRKPQAELETLLQPLREQAGTGGANAVWEHCLSWDELRALGEDSSVTVGAHTLSHPVLANESLNSSRREIAQSRLVIEQHLRRPVRHFAYPFGDRSAVGPREFEVTMAAGYSTAVTTRPGHIFSAHADHLHALPRVSINGLFQNEHALRSLLTGTALFLSNGARRVNVG
ncbi:polysaccharide deacetylase family protein [Microvirga massiliensis]|uniref:polysaccharide deacetylase family protein n=1 Tax=Microvirga massiliensis TaxID=1033741 RepID=UPI00062BCECC|nr:polysaccharide deacetylase family protein [Microvirga massiliensis]